MITTIPATAKLWIYTSDRDMSQEEEDMIQKDLDQFLETWNTHGTKLDAQAFPFHSRLLFFTVDESKQYASGCAVDSSVNMVKQLGEKYGIDFFNRNQFIYIKGDYFKSVTPAELKEKYQSGEINDETYFVNTLVTSKEELKNWIQPLSSSWIYKFAK